MAITINPQILGQEVTDICTYCYLYEPLSVSISESNLAALKIFIDIEVVDTTNGAAIVESLVEYGEYDINSGELLTVDLMKLARQHHDAELFKFATIDDINAGWDSVVSKYKYRFKIYSDETATPKEVFKLPIIGGRLFKDFEPLVTSSNLLTEAEVYGVDLKDKWCNKDTIETTLVDPTLIDARPIIIIDEQISDPNTFFVGIDESESSLVAVDESEQIDYIGL